MKYIVFFLVVNLQLFAGLLSSKIVELNQEAQTAKIVIDKVDVGVSGYVVHHITPEHSSILKRCVVTAYDPATKTATIKMQQFDMLKNNALPSGKWEVAVGDSVELAFAYTRSLLVSPSEEIYYQISKAVNTQWIHPDIFATLLSFEGHPTPLLSDFKALATSSSVGLIFIYLDKKLYTVDSNSFKILHIDEAPLTQDSVQLPFYSRVEEIDANWFGAGSDKMESYEPHYYELLVENNPTNKALYAAVKNSTNEEVNSLVDQFEIGE